MMVRLSTFLLGLILVSSSGCAMCCSPYDDAYSAYGGSVERGDLYYGRVNSHFSDVQVQGVSEVQPPQKLPTVLKNSSHVEKVTIVREDDIALGPEPLPTL
ncbi:MAG: hypothetical protein MPJ24_02900 [Pirellulaceae bacterium]|nr:hypothetical protein [Pirellulaceae bacterium]